MQQQEQHNIMKKKITAASSEKGRRVSGGAGIIGLRWYSARLPPGGAEETRAWPVCGTKT